MQQSFVLPGDKVGSTEEYVAGHGTYSKGGFIYAATTGVVGIDQKSRLAYVVPTTNAPPTLSIGDIVVGQVSDLKEGLAIVFLSYKRGYESRPLPRTDATVHISNVKNSYVKDIRQVFGLRDILRAKIVDDRLLRLSTEDSDLGVLKAYCGRCMTPLVQNNDKLLCKSCNRTEMRKLSSEYGLGVI